MSVHIKLVEAIAASHERGRGRERSWSARRLANSQTINPNRGINDGISRAAAGSTRTGPSTNVAALLRHPLATAIWQRIRDRSRRVLAVGSVMAAAAALLVLAPQAAAEPPRSLATQIPGVTETAGIAINSVDDVWIGEPTKGVISEYAPYPSTEKIGEVGNGTLAVQAVAINDTTGYLYAVVGGTVDVFDPSAANHEEPIETWKGVTEQQDIAVDNSAGPSAGTVYVLTCNSGYPCGGSLSAYHPNGTPAEFEVTETNSISTGNDYEVAVDNQGNIYLANAAGGAVEEFNPAGEQFASFTRPPSVAEYYPSDVAVDPTSGNVLAFNGSYGGSYPSAEIDEFLSTGEYVDRITGTSIAPLGGFNRIRLAVNSKGYLYVGEPGAKVDVFYPNVVVPKITYRTLSEFTATSAVLAATVDPRESEEGANVTECSFEYGLARDEYSLGSLPCLNTANEQVGTVSKPIESTTEVHAKLTGLTPEAAYHYRIVVRNGPEPVNVESGADQTYTPHYVTDVETEEPSKVEGTSATLNGSFLGNGEVVHYYFEWGLTKKYGNKTAEPPGTLLSTSPGSTESVMFRITGKLEPLTHYHYRVIVENAHGISYGRDRGFKTTPSVPLISESVKEVHSDRALLVGRINPGGADTKYHFEWGVEECSANPDPCTAVPTSDIDIGSARGFQTVSYQLGGLTPGTVYHYRVVATNEESPEGGTVGSERTFTTFPFVQFADECPNAHVRQQTGSALLLDCRGYELVSASNANGYDVESDLVGGQEPFSGYPLASSSTGVSRLLYGIRDGGIPGDGNPTNDGLNPYVATRGKEGWSTSYVGIPADDPVAKAPFASTLDEADSSLDTFAFSGEEICSPCFEDGSTGIPVHRPNGELVQGMKGSIAQPTAKPEGFIGRALSADGTHLVFGSKSQFEPEGNDNGDISIYDRDLETGATHVVSKTPGGTTMTGPGIGELGISSDGSRIVVGQLVDEEGNAKYWHLYMNIGDSGKTIDLTPGTTHGVLFDGMTENGSKVFFSSVDHLTGQEADHSGADLFEAEVSEEGAATLNLISKGTEETPGAPGDAATCDPAANTKHEHWNTTGSEENCGIVAVGGGGGVASGDGTIYFLSPEKLAGASNGVQNAPNLYVSRPGQRPHFVATLESNLNAPFPEAQRPLLRSFGAFTKVTGTAVGPEEDVYVLDLTEEEVGGYIEKFDPSGHLLTSFASHGKLTGSNTPAGSFAEYGPANLAAEIAVDQDPNSPSFGDLYVPDLLNSVIDKFSPSGEYLSQIEMPYPGAVAVDAANGDVYATQAFGGESVYVFDANGKPITNFPSISFPTGVAVNTEGTVYVVNGGGIIGISGMTEVYKPSSQSPLEYEPASGTELDAFHPARGVAVEPSDNHVYIDEGSQIAEFEATGKQIGVPFATFLSGSVSLTASARKLYVSNPGPGKVSVLGAPEIVDPEADSPLVIDSVSEPSTRRTADLQVTPNGADAVFTSALGLTGYENGGHREVFRFDSPSETLLCVSCSQTGEEASGEATLAANGLSLTEDGRVFFNSTEGLVDRDLNEREDVYEWEPDGAGPERALCRSAEGCLDLISTGISPYNSSLLSASEEGSDVFFFTRDSLVRGDINGSHVRIYDAREEGGYPYVPPEVPCKASDECHGAGSPAPSPPNIQSFSNSPGGNEPGVQPGVRKCRRGFVRRNGHCVKRASRHQRGRRRKRGKNENGHHQRRASHV